MPFALKRAQVAEPLDQFEFNYALKKALSSEGYRFRINAGDEFILFARRATYAAKRDASEEEFKLDILHANLNGLSTVAYMDCKMIYYDNGESKSICSRAIQWDVSDRAPEHIKLAERSRAAEEAILVRDDYSAHGRGCFKGIGSFLLCFHTAYAKSKGIKWFIFAEPSSEGEKLIRSFYSNCSILEVRGETYALLVDISEVNLPKPNIMRV